MDGSLDVTYGEEGPPSKKSRRAAKNHTSSPVEEGEADVSKSVKPNRLQDNTALKSYTKEELNSKNGVIVSSIPFSVTKNGSTSTIDSSKHELVEPTIDVAVPKSDEDKEEKTRTETSSSPSKPKPRTRKKKRKKKAVTVVKNKPGSKVAADVDQEHIKAKRKAAYLRKNIKQILQTETLGEETLAAQREEAERRERMNLKLHQLKLIQAQAAAVTTIVSPSGVEAQDNSVNNSEPKELVQLKPNSNPDDLLHDVGVSNSNQNKSENRTSSISLCNEEIVISSDDESEVNNSQSSFGLPQYHSSELLSRLTATAQWTERNRQSSSIAPEAAHYRNNLTRSDTRRDRADAGEYVISISSGEEEECDNEVSHLSLSKRREHWGKIPHSEKPTTKKFDSDDDDCVVISPTPDKDDDKDEKDLDEVNVKDSMGRVLVNVGHPEEDPDIFLPPQVTAVVKPHQIGGIRFLYDNILESVDMFDTANGFGCILAHSMGLGKTLQAVAFCDAFLRSSKAKTVLIIVPINTIQNWLNEFNVWLPPGPKKSDKKKKQNSSKRVATTVEERSETTPDPIATASLTESLTDTVSLNLSFDSTLNLNAFADVDGPKDEDQQNGNSQNGIPDETKEKVEPRQFQVYLLNETVKTLQNREKTLAEWSTKGGVMLIGYEMYRMLALKKLKKSSKKLACLNGEERSNEASSLDRIHSYLVDPGPDLVICDEGHRIKNSGASISQALKAIRTRRRVVLTGYPLQNNLMEYWCMVDFIRPNYLGSKVEFSNMFERPISNGQCVDSTPDDKRLMKYRSHVLHSLLEGFVQRRSHAVLHHALPEKREWVFLLKMTPVQYKLYTEFMQFLSDSSDGQCGANPIKAFAVCCKIWNHPDALYNVVRRKQSILDDLDLDEIKGNGGSYSRGRSSGGSRGRKTKPDEPAQISYFDGSGFVFPKSHYGSYNAPRQTSESTMSLDWALPIFENYVPGILENGAKFEILFDVIRETVAVNDKMLIFSQTLLSLDLLESFFHQKFNWTKNEQYYRLDGSTTGLERERLVNNFNSKEGVFIFIVSTRAGSLGINLIGANRVVVLDASFNPCHDCQAVCRIYRYGQIKPCYIYRFVSDCTLEKRIYDRQVNKRGMSDRVIDEMNPNAQFKSKDVSNFLAFKHDHLDKAQFTNCVMNPEKYSDPILQSVIVKHGDKITQEPFEHESLLIDQKSQRLSATEKRLALRNYQHEKRTAEMQTAAGFTYSRPSYAAFYPKDGHSTTSSNMASSAYSQRYIMSNSSALSSYNSSPQLDKFEQHVPALRAKGICVQSIVLKKDSFLSDPTGGPDMYLMAGEKIYVLRSEKGTYLRISNGKLIAVTRNNPSNIRFPILSLPPSQDLTKEQLQTLVHSFLKTPGMEAPASEFNFNNPSYNSTVCAPPVEQHLPPSPRFFSQSKNQINVTNTRSNSGGNVTTMWQQCLTTMAESLATASPTVSKSGSSSSDVHLRSPSLSALLESSYTPSFLSPSINKLSYLSRLSEIAQRQNEQERMRNSSSTTTSSGSFPIQSPFSFLPSQYSNYVVPPLLPTVLQQPDLEVIPITTSSIATAIAVNSSTPASPIALTTNTNPQHSNSFHGYPSDNSSHSLNNNNIVIPNESHSKSNDAAPSFYEDFTITVRNPKDRSQQANASSDRLTPQDILDIQSAYQRNANVSMAGKILYSDSASAPPAGESESPLNFRTFEQYYGNACSYPTTSSSSNSTNGKPTNNNNNNSQISDQSTLLPK